MRHRVSVVLGLVMAAAACEAQAQAPTTSDQAAPAKPAAKSKPAGRTVEGVTVTGASQGGMRTSIDRRSYGVASDLAATTGSISDALKNIPSVEVDVQGKVSLRGDPNVTIMIDGKPSSLLRGAGAAQALQAMPADSIERVEVITNPSAQYSPEGTAGIINLITKQTRKAGRSGSVRANAGTAGRRNVGVSLAYNAERLTLSADAGARHDPQHSVNDDARTLLDPATGRPVARQTESLRLRGPVDQWNARLGADYDLDKTTRLSAEVRHNTFDFEPTTLVHFESLDAAGALTRVADQDGVFGGSDRDNTAGQVSLRRKFAGDDHTLNVNLSRERTDERSDNRYTTIDSLPVAPDVFQEIRGHNALTQTDLKADYSRPMPGDGRLKAGFDLRGDHNDYDAVGVRGPNPGAVAPDPTQTNLFLYRQEVDAAYATYEQPFGAWTALAGLRLEDVRLDLNQVTTGFAHRQDYFRAYPSLHLAYKIDDDQQLTFSYSHRIQRPQPQDFNPFRFTSPFSAQQGNPNLQPQQTDSFEAGYQYKASGTIYLATAYYRQNHNGVTDVVSELPDGLLLTTKENLSQSRSAGLELVANGKLSKALSYNVSTNLYWNEIDASRIPLGPGLGFGGVRSAFTAGGRGSLSWQATPNDLFQVSGQLNAKRLLPQGFSDPMFLMFLGYRHKFDDSLSVVVTAQDPLNIYRFAQTIDTPVLHEHVTGRGRIQAAFVGLSWSFGAARKRPQGFDFTPG